MTILNENTVLNYHEEQIVGEMIGSEGMFNNVMSAVIHYDLVYLKKHAEDFLDGWHDRPHMNINPLRIWNYYREAYGDMIFRVCDCESNDVPFENGCCLPECCSSTAYFGARCADYNFER